LLGAYDNASRLMRHAQGPHPVCAADLQHLAGDERMHVKVLVRVDVIERQSRSTKKLELSGDFAPQLTAYARAERNIAGKPDHIGPKHSLAADQVWNVFRWRSRCTVDQHQMQANS
jgi:hypothetical protein